MCVGVPMQVIEGDGEFALCESNREQARVNMMLTGPQAPGSWILVFQGSAVRSMAEDEARQMRAALAALDAALNGQEDLDIYFADLAGREPTLPPHLIQSRQESDS
jgi:hydrogenase expression/formation protein HypC